jgi:magnesium transporter
MKFLASVTILLSVPTMIASFYGMNVNLPAQQYESAFLCWRLCPYCFLL